MRLCVNCINFSVEQDGDACLEDYWTTNDHTKAKIYNPMMFECLSYESSKDSPAFADDHIFDLYLEMTK